MTSVLARLCFSLLCGPLTHCLLTLACSFIENFAGKDTGFHPSNMPVLQNWISRTLQSGVTSTPLNAVDRVSMEGSGQGPSTPGQAPAVSYRLVKFDSSSGGQLGDTPGRFMLSGESATASTNLFQTASLAKPANKKVCPKICFLPCFACYRLPPHLDAFGNQR